jgi:hypothetical protein
MSQYDSAMFYSRKHHLVDGGGLGLSVVGTNAAAADIYRAVWTENITVDELTVAALTGGTAAGPIVTVNTSVGGTGSLVPIGTFKIGTTANNGNLPAITIASSSLTAGDHLVLQVAAGTAAATPKFLMCIGYKTNLV